MNTRMYSDDCGLPWVALGFLWAGVFVVTIAALEAGSRVLGRVTRR